MSVIKSLLLIYLMLVLALYFLQRKMIYHPTADLAHDFETVHINHQAQSTEALLTHGSQLPVVIYFGGNAENVIYSANDFATHLPNHSTYLMKYRGYSGASGEPSEENIYADALALYDHINQQPNLQITVIGRSMGSAVATYLATKRKVDQLILVTPFDSVAEVAKSLLPIFPIDWLLHDRFDSKSRASLIKAPTLLLWAKFDEVIPSINTESLIQSIPAHLLHSVAIKAGHNDIDLTMAYFNQIKMFLNNSINMVPIN